MTTLTENRIVVSAKNDAHIQWALDHLLHGVAEAFGGFTRTDGTGAWRSPAGILHLDPVAVIDVAAPHTAETRDRLRELCRDYCTRSDEETAYLRFADGTVEIA